MQTFFRRLIKANTNHGGAMLIPSIFSVLIDIIFKVLLICSINRGTDLSSIKVQHATASNTETVQTSSNQIINL